MLAVTARDVHWSTKGKIMMQSMQDLEERELRDAAFHEASHVVLATFFGGFARARVWRNPVQLNDMRAWLGRCELITPPGVARWARGTKRSSGAIRMLPVRWRRYLGLAGFAGEKMAEGLTEPWQIEEAYWSAEEAGEISESDLRMIAGPVRERDIAQTTKYLRQQWALVECTAKALMAAAPLGLP